MIIIDDMLHGILKKFKKDAWTEDLQSGTRINSVQDDVTYF